MKCHIKWIALSLLSLCVMFLFGCASTPEDRIVKDHPVLAPVDETKSNSIGLSSTGLILWFSTGNSSGIRARASDYTWEEIRNSKCRGMRHRSREAGSV